MSKSTITRIKAHCELGTAVTVAVTAALEAGMAPADIAAVLTRIAELLEQED